MAITTEQNLQAAYQTGTAGDVLRAARQLVSEGKEATITPSTGTVVSRPYQGSSHRETPATQTAPVVQTPTQTFAAQPFKIAGLPEQQPTSDKSTKQAQSISGYVVSTPSGLKSSAFESGKPIIQPSISQFNVKEMQAPKSTNIISAKPSGPEDYGESIKDYWSKQNILAGSDISKAGESFKQGTFWGVLGGVGEAFKAARRYTTEPVFGDIVFPLTGSTLLTSTAKTKDNAALASFIGSNAISIGPFQSAADKALIPTKWSGQTYGTVRQNLELDYLKKNQEIRDKVKEAEKLQKDIDSTLGKYESKQPTSNKDAVVFTVTDNTGKSKDYYIDNTKDYNRMQKSFDRLSQIGGDVQKFEAGYGSMEDIAIHKAPWLYGAAAIGQTVLEAGTGGGFFKDVGGVKILDKMTAMTQATPRAQQIVNLALLGGGTTLSAVGGAKEYIERGESPYAGAITRALQTFAGFRAFEVGANPQGPKLLRFSSQDVSPQDRFSVEGAPSKQYYFSTENPYSLKPRATILASATTGEEAGLIKAGLGTSGMSAKLPVGSDLIIAENPTQLAAAAKYYPNQIAAYKNAIYELATNPTKFTKPVNPEGLESYSKMPGELQKTTTNIFKRIFKSSGEWKGDVISVGGGTAYDKSVKPPSDIDFKAISTREYNRIANEYGNTIKESDPLKYSGWKVKADPDIAKITLVSPDGKKMETYNIPNANAGLEVPSSIKRYGSYQSRQDIYGQTGRTPTPEDLALDNLNRIFYKIKVGPEGEAKFTYNPKDINLAKAEKIAARTDISSKDNEITRLIESNYPGSIQLKKAAITESPLEIPGAPKVESNIVAVGGLVKPFTNPYSTTAELIQSEIPGAMPSRSGVGSGTTVRISSAVSGSGKSVGPSSSDDSGSGSGGSGSGSGGSGSLSGSRSSGSHSGSSSSISPSSSSSSSSSSGGGPYWLAYGIPGILSGKGPSGGETGGYRGGYYSASTVTHKISPFEKEIFGTAAERAVYRGTVTGVQKQSTNDKISMILGFKKSSPTKKPQRFSGAAGKPKLALSTNDKIMKMLGR
jgi:hypothetical protein